MTKLIVQKIAVFAGMQRLKTEYLVFAKSKYGKQDSAPLRAKKWGTINRY